MGNTEKSNQQTLGESSISQIMGSNPFAIGPEEKITRVEELLHEKGYNSLFVVSESGQVLGIISQRELFSDDYEIYLPFYAKLVEQSDFIKGAEKNLLYSTKQTSKTTAKEIMNTKAVFLTKEMTIKKAAKIFEQQDISPLPVVDSGNRLLGVVSKGDLLKFLLNLEYIKPPVHPAKFREADVRFNFASNHLLSNFAVITKAKARVWVAAAVILFVVGFLVGVAYVADF